MWQTYTPDGRLLLLRRSATGWLATCLANRAESEDAAEAIRGAVGAPVSGTQAELDEWIGEHIAALTAGVAEVEEGS